jgi:hypothetical protein
VFTPAPARTIRDSTLRSSIASVTFVLRTTSTSAPVDASAEHEGLVRELGLVDDLAAGSGDRSPSCVPRMRQR